MCWLSPGIHERDYSQKLHSYLLVKENTLEKIRDFGFEKYSRKNRNLHNLHKNNRGEKNLINRNITQRSNTFREKSSSLTMILPKY